MIHNAKIIEIVQEKTADRPATRETLMKLLEFESEGTTQYKRYYKQLIESDAERGFNEVREH